MLCVFARSPDGRLPSRIVSWGVWFAFYSSHADIAGNKDRRWVRFLRDAKNGRLFFAPLVKCCGARIRSTCHPLLMHCSLRTPIGCGEGVARNVGKDGCSGCEDFISCWRRIGPHATEPSVGPTARNVHQFYTCDHSNTRLVNPVNICALPPCRCALFNLPCVNLICRCVAQVSTPMVFSTSCTASGDCIANLLCGVLE